MKFILKASGATLATDWASNGTIHAARRLTAEDLLGLKVRLDIPLNGTVYKLRPPRGQEPVDWMAGEVTLISIHCSEVPLASITADQLRKDMAQKVVLVCMEHVRRESCEDRLSWNDFDWGRDFRCPVDPAIRASLGVKTGVGFDRGVQAACKLWGNTLPGGSPIETLVCCPCLRECPSDPARMRCMYDFLAGHKPRLPWERLRGYEFPFVKRFP